MKLVRILPYKPGSRSARVLARAVNGLRVRMNGLFRPKLRHMVINWGGHVTPRWWTGGLNAPDKVAVSSNKLRALSMMKAAGVSIPEFTTNVEVAKQWYREKKVVVGRRVLSGSQGIGIHIFSLNPEHDAPEEPNGCPLYTQHLRHKREFRIHVFGASVIHMAEKRRRRGFENRSEWVRNHANGYVFCTDNLDVPAVVQEQAVAATRAVGLDFGAVDVVFREKEGRAFVLEVNSAPGMEGRTIEKYAQAIRERAARG